MSINSGNHYNQNQSKMKILFAIQFKEVTVEGDVNRCSKKFSSKEEIPQKYYDYMGAGNGVYHSATLVELPTFEFVKTSELENGVTMHELCAAEGLAWYVNENRAKESMVKTESEFAEILGIGTESESDQDALHYAVNVCRRLFPHQVNYKA